MTFPAWRGGEILDPPKENLREGIAGRTIAKDRDDMVGGKQVESHRLLE